MTAASASHSPPLKRPAATSPSPTPPLTRGASARSALSPRITGSLSASRARISARSATPPSVNGTISSGEESKEPFATSLKRETELKEQLLVQLENKEQSILYITKENDKLASALSSAEGRLSELYTDQGRAEEELAARIEVIEKLRTQVRELEKEKRDLYRRYNEQTTTFEAERQAFYDNEQHLKSRIQSLSQARRHPAPRPSPLALDSESEAEPDEEDDMEQVQELPKQGYDDSDSEPAEITALKLELSTLSTSYNSMQNSLVLLQTQLVDLKRVNNELQEENESYNILLRERTLNGQFDLFRQVGGVPGSSNSEQGEDDDSIIHLRDDDTGSLRSNARSALDPVDETPEGREMDPHLTFDLEVLEADSSTSSRRHQSRQGRNKRGGSTSHSPARGESLANLPITGPGLDLAAELGRAENKDILEGRGVEDRDRSVTHSKDRRDKKRSTDRKGSVDVSTIKESRSTAGLDIDALRTEVKALKDANKALSLYASKIIDRIISQEGFEHVLAIDYEKEASPLTPALSSSQAPPSKSPSQSSSKLRSQSVMLGRSNSLQSPIVSPAEKLTTFESIHSPKPPTSSASDKASRRSMSFDWNNLNPFGGSGEKKPDMVGNLRPLTLKPGGSSLVSGARKLDTEEDDEDRRERERLAATMKLMGIDKPATLPSHPPVMEKSQSTPTEPTAATSSRFSFFRRKSATASSFTSDASSTKSAPTGFRSPNLDQSRTNLTQEALEQAEAENGLAVLDAHERSLSMELAKGSGGGFTEIPRSGRKSRRSAGGSGSGSTVWSAGFTD